MCMGSLIFPGAKLELIIINGLNYASDFDGIIIELLKGKISIPSQLTVLYL